MRIAKVALGLWLLSLPVLGQTPASFMQRDLDGNGRLTQPESQLTPSSFQAVDASGNGELSLGEFYEHWKQVAPAPDVADVSYGPAPRQTLDLYLPALSKEAAPLVIWIHGGRWQEGSKQNCPFQTLTAQGFLVASVNYRLVPQDPFPAQLDDCRSALRWVKEEAQRRGFQISTVSAVGLSAGGHLALLLGCENQVDAAVSFGSPVDLTDSRAQEQHRETLENLVGKPLESKLEGLRLASPLYQVEATKAKFFLFHGLEDRTIPYEQATLMAQALANAKAYSQVTLVPDGSHTLVGGPPAWGQLVQVLGGR